MISWVVTAATFVWGRAFSKCSAGTRYILLRVIVVAVVACRAFGTADYLELATLLIVEATGIRLLGL